MSEQTDFSVGDSALTGSNEADKIPQEGENSPAHIDSTIVENGDDLQIEDLKNGQEMLSEFGLVLEEM